MTFHRTFRTIAGIAAVAVAIGFGSAAALAQPAGGPHGPHGGHGPGMGGPDEMIGHLIAHAKTKLNLNTMQQGMFDTAVADSKGLEPFGGGLGVPELERVGLAAGGLDGGSGQRVGE